MESVQILIAEDEALILLDLEQGLTDAGFVVVTTTTGAGAIELLKGADPPILGLITDIRFGEPPDGWEVARAAREIDPQMAVVYVSGDSAADWPAKGVPDSIMLEKPFAMAQLVTAISQLLNERRAD